MDKRDKPPSLADLEARLRTARAREKESQGRPRDDDGRRMSGIGIGFRIAVELVAGVMVGVGIGYGLDWWLGTRPLLMVLFLFLGAAAGVMNIYRTVKGLGDTVGLGEAQKRKSAQDVGSEERRNGG